MAKHQNTEAERRKSVEIAIADSLMEGLPPPGPAEQAILDAYVRGEIEACDLVEACKRMVEGLGPVREHILFRITLKDRHSFLL